MDAVADTARATDTVIDGTTATAKGVQAADDAVTGWSKLSRTGKGLRVFGIGAGAAGAAFNGFMAYNEYSAAAAIEDNEDLKGVKIGKLDILIAAIILVNGYDEILTNNVSHYENIEELTIYTY